MQPAYLAIKITEDYPDKVREFRKHWPDMEVAEVRIEYKGNVKTMTIEEFLELTGLHMHEWIKTDEWGYNCLCGAYKEA